MIASHLRPDPEQLGAEWKSLVEAEKEQTERVREWQEQDYYQSMTGHFVADPRREDDERVNLLRSYCAPDATWLDVGAGGGRNALPLALLSRKVIAIEPSPAMRAALEQSMRQYDISNVEVLDLRWPEGADRIEVDYSLMAHVGYDISEINPFLDALERATRRRCFAVMMDRAPSGGFDDYWPLIHGEQRVVLPALREFIHLLVARGATPEVRIFAHGGEPYTPEHLRESARRRLWLAEGSPKDQQLQQILDEELSRSPDTFHPPHVVGVVNWESVRSD